MRRSLTDSERARRHYKRSTFIVVGAEFVTSSWFFSFGFWIGALIPLVCAVVLTLLYRRNTKSYPLCPACGHYVALHALRSPDPLHTWGWIRCVTAESGEECECWGTFTEMVAPEIKLHQEREVLEYIARWVEDTGEAPR
jgi:hypothetical protein